MKAIIFRQEGFRKDVWLEKRSPWVRMAKFDSTKFVESEIDMENIPFDIIEYRLERTFLNEYEEEVLIYKELA